MTEPYPSFGGSRAVRGWMDARRWLACVTVIGAAILGCTTETPGPPAPDVPNPSGVSAEARRAIADTVTRLIEEAYDFTGPDPVGRIMGLYPDSGAVISASSGRVSASRDALQGGIASFWEAMGRNMREPKWVWGDRHIEVLSPTAAVLTATYTIPHIAPSGEAHVVGGAWTAVFQKRSGVWRIIQEHLSAGPPMPPME